MFGKMGVWLDRLGGAPERNWLGDKLGGDT